MNIRLLVKVTALCLITVVSAGSVGCKKKPRAVAGPGPGMDTTAVVPPAPLVEPLGMGQRIGSAATGERNQPPRLKNDTVYFAFDSAVVNPSERPKLDDMVAYIRENPNQNITVEGHCHERGTEEYNRSLGERRAQACREYLISTGIDGTKVQTISYGKEKPANPGHNDEAWAQNRRSEFIITGQ